MNKQLKSLRKDLAKLSKKFDFTDGLTLRTSYDTHVSVHRKGREQSPLVTFGWKGDYSIPVVKLVLIVLLAISGISAVVMLVSRIVERQRERKLRRERERRSMECYNAYCPEYYDPDFMPF